MLHSLLEAVPDSPIGGPQSLAWESLHAVRPGQSKKCLTTTPLASQSKVMLAITQPATLIIITIITAADVIGNLSIQVSKTVHAPPLNHFEASSVAALVIHFL
jgi:hypothetical protein